MLKGLVGLVALHHTMKTVHPTHSTNAFTLMEMLVVVAIIGIVVGIGVPMLRDAKTDSIADKQSAALANVATAKARYILDYTATALDADYANAPASVFNDIQPYLKVNGVTPAVESDILSPDQGGLVIYGNSTIPPRLPGSAPVAETPQNALDALVAAYTAYQNAPSGDWPASYNTLKAAYDTFESNGGGSLMPADAYSMELAKGMSAWNAYGLAADTVEMAIQQKVNEELANPNLTQDERDAINAYNTAAFNSLMSIPQPSYPGN
jgi:prepilin-type N-terminal cleavage/methylation domain-containing protein